MTLGYLGPEGSYSGLAAKTFAAEAELKAYASFPLVVSALVAGECDYIVLPVENSLNGGVYQNLDLLQATDGVVAFKECALKLFHRLATLEGAKIEDIKRVYSHEQSLGQCRKFLTENLSRAELIATPSTAAGLKMLKKKTDACIVGAHVNKDGVKLWDEDIADEDCNVTHFLLVKRGRIKEGTHSQKVFFSATCLHEAGGLFGLLEPIKDGGFNMTRINSRPIKDKFGEYRFFIEVEGDFAGEELQAVLNNIKKVANSFKILGVY